ncbi:MAG: hypothetical protein M3Z35_12195 [Nitrospirota bacterium]|nr:hypothetical protein [Nitrospirota bacterium]
MAAAYYHIKESVGSPGKVYFNLALCSSSTLQPSKDRPEWLPAYQVDVGQPVSQPTLFQDSDQRWAPLRVQNLRPRVHPRAGVGTSQRLLGLHGLWRARGGDGLPADAHAPAP